MVLASFCFFLLALCCSSFLFLGCVGGWFDIGVGGWINEVGCRFFVFFVDVFLTFYLKSHISKFSFSSVLMVAG